MIEHVAIIMDGSRHWAEKSCLPPAAAREAAAGAARAVVRAAAATGVGNLSLFPAEEDGASFLLPVLAEWLAANLRIRYVGRGTLSPEQLAELGRAEQAAAGNQGMCLNLVLDYDGRVEITDAAARVAEEIEAGSLTPEDADEEQIARHLYRPELPDVDLLIRTGGETHLAGFMLWQIAYAELVFFDTKWPEFTPDDLAAAIAEFGRRTRKFGAINTI